MVFYGRSRSHPAVTGSFCYSSCIVFVACTVEAYCKVCHYYQLSTTVITLKLGRHFLSVHGLISGPTSKAFGSAFYDRHPQQETGGRATSVGQGQNNLKGAALAQCGLTHDGTAMFFGDDLMGDRQAKSSTFAGFFGGKEWFK